MTTPQVEYQWATCCVDCDDGPTFHDDEDAARRAFALDLRSEARARDHHRVQLIRRPVPEWEVVAEVPAQDGGQVDG